MAGPPRHTADRTKLDLFANRSHLLVGLIGVVVLLAGLRAFQVTVVNASQLRSKADSQQMKQGAVPAPRGDISDRHGTPLAVSEPSYDVIGNPRIIADPKWLANELSPLLGVAQSELLPKLSDRSTGFVYLARRVPAAAGDQIRKLKYRGKAVDGLSLEVTMRRSYPRGMQSGQLIGIVGTEGKGLSGLEYAYDDVLRGTDGQRTTVFDGKGRTLLVEDSREMKQGHNIALTIDAPVQDEVERVLEGVAQVYRPKGATAIVADPRSGEILALANYPAIDGNDVGELGQYAQLNKATGFTYEPGSTFKAITIASAIQAGAVKPGTQFFLPVELQAGDKTIHDSHPRGAETLPVSEILAQSSNVGAAKIGLATGKESFNRWIHRFGFDAPTGVGLPGEERGLVLAPERYSAATLPNMAMGQGLSVTPMQMVQAYSAIANGGVKITPRIVRSINGRKVAPRQSRRLISRRTSSQMREMLRGVLADGGTASGAAIEGFDLAGKTGTAQKVDPATGTYSTSKYIASFIGFAPARNPQLLVAVVVDEPFGDIYGGSVAAPAFSRIMAFALPYLGISPN